MYFMGLRYGEEMHPEDYILLNLDETKSCTRSAARHLRRKRMNEARKHVDEIKQSTFIEGANINTDIDSTKVKDVEQVEVITKSKARRLRKKNNKAKLLEGCCYPYDYSSSIDTTDKQETVANKEVENEETIIKSKPHRSKKEYNDNSAPNHCYETKIFNNLKENHKSDKTKPLESENQNIKSKEVLSCLSGNEVQSQSKKHGKTKEHLVSTSRSKQERKEGIETRIKCDKEDRLPERIEAQSCSKSKKDSFGSGESTITNLKTLDPKESESLEAESKPPSNHEIFKNVKNLKLNDSPKVDDYSSKQGNKSPSNVEIKTAVNFIEAQSITHSAPALGTLNISRVSQPSTTLLSKMIETKTNVSEKSREEIKAERDAKKAAKAAAKAKAKTGKEQKKPEQKPAASDKIESVKSNDFAESTDKKNVQAPSKIPDKTSNLPIKDTVAPDVPSEGKSKAEMRAERRAKQEAQRQAKQQSLSDKSKPKSKETSDKPSRATKNDIAKKTASVPKKVTPKDNAHEANLFKHLYHERELAFVDVPLINSNIHPAIVRLGAQYASKVIVGSNARCVALLAAVKQLIHDFERPSQADFIRGLEASLKETVAYLHHARPLAVSMQNAMRHLKWQMTQLPSTLADVDAKIKLESAIDTYIQEQIELADKAISLTIQTKISNGNVILTYGYSSLIHKILLDAHTAGKKFRVIVVDGRPWLEGKEQLRRLATHGIECSYIMINALSYVMPEVSKVFLGAHAILANGAVMSRVGTAQVALMARAFNVPVLVACETHKTCERVQTDSIVYNELGNADELAQNRGSNAKKSFLANWRTKKSLNLLNITYDVTPADLVTAVVTELAILPCTSVPVILRIKPSEI